MRFLKFIGGVGLVLLAILLILPLLMKDHAETSYSIVIKADAKTVFRMVNKLENWKMWSPFYTGDDLKSSFSGPVQGVGNTLRWQHSGSGGMQEIIVSEPYQHIESKLDMGRFADAIDEWRFEDTATGVKVTWTLRLSKLSYPFHKYFGYFIESTMKPLQRKGLDKLKEIVEQQPAVPVVFRDTLPDMLALAILDSVMMDSLSVRMKENYESLKMTMKSSRAAAAGPAFAVFYNWTPDKPIYFRVGIPVAEEARASDRVDLYKVKGGEVLKITSKGGYQGLAAAHQEMDAFMADFGLHLRGKGVMEVYEVGTEQTADSTAWITQVIYPIE